MGTTPSSRSMHVASPLAARNSAIQDFSIRVKFGVHRGRALYVLFSKESVRLVLLRNCRSIAPVAQSTRIRCALIVSDIDLHAWSPHTCSASETGDKPSDAESVWSSSACAKSRIRLPNLTRPVMLPSYCIVSCHEVAVLYLVRTFSGEARDEVLGLRG